MSYEVLTIRVDKDLKDQLDKEWKEKDFDNRAEYIRYLLNKGTNMNGLRKKIRRLKEDGSNLIEQGQRKLKEAEYLANKSQEEVGDAELVRDQIEDMIITEWKREQGYVLTNEAPNFVYAKIPERVDGEIEWIDDEEAVRVLHSNAPGETGDFEEHAEKVLDLWIEEGLFKYKGE